MNEDLRKMMFAGERNQGIAIGDALQRLDVPLACGYKKCPVVFGPDPSVGVPYGPEHTRLKQDFEARIYAHLREAGHKQYRLAIHEQSPCLLYTSPSPRDS